MLIPLSVEEEEKRRQEHSQQGQINSSKQAVSGDINNPGLPGIQTTTGSGSENKSRGGHGGNRVRVSSHAEYVKPDVIDTPHVDAPSQDAQLSQEAQLQETSKAPESSE